MRIVSNLPDLHFVMAVLVTAIHARSSLTQDVDGRDSACGRPGHDGQNGLRHKRLLSLSRKGRETR
jgi:hypothetical protein